MKKILADVRASSNVIPYTMFKNIGLSESQPTRITLQLADRSISHHRGIIEDVYIKVDKFIFPIDFVILDVDDDVKLPLIIYREVLSCT